MMRGDGEQSRRQHAFLCQSRPGTCHVQPPAPDIDGRFRLTPSSNSKSGSFLIEALK